MDNNCTVINKTPNQSMNECRPPSVVSNTSSSSNIVASSAANTTTTTTKTTVTTTIINNPYIKNNNKNKSSSNNNDNNNNKDDDDDDQEDFIFIGGAQRTRMNARKKLVPTAKKKCNNKKGPTRIKIPGEMTEEERLNQKLPIHMNSLERFFACLLRSTAKDFYESYHSITKSTELWNVCCHRAGVSTPTESIRPIYNNPKIHFNVRIALILEEARYSIANGIEEIWKKKKQQQQQQQQNNQNRNNYYNNNRNNNNNNNSSNNFYRSNSNASSSMSLTVHKIEELKSTGHVKITFVSQRIYTKEQLYHIRPCSILHCIPVNNNKASVIENVFLAVITSSNKEQIEQKNMFTCIVFRKDNIPDNILQGIEYIVTPITQLITELRCFEAMQIMPSKSSSTKISFLSSLLGKVKTHTRFDDDGNCIVSTKEIKKQKLSDYETTTTTTTFSSSSNNQYFRLPTLNETQEAAAISFLSSEQNTITLVQGPPGTGKTTLLVSILCRYLTDAIELNKNYRIMVSAPSNKAVSVLATRFMEAMKDNCPCNAIIVGDGDKLLGDESNNMHSGPLKSIFLYSWIQNVIDGYTRIRAYFMPHYRGRDTVYTLFKLASQLQKRILNSLSHLSDTLVKMLERITNKLKSLLDGGEAHDIVLETAKLLKEIKEMQPDAVWSELLLSANVIFCTLSSAGGTVLKKTSPINDLIVDEAAAATEPELYIPFHLQPTRLLAVGDPLQLPATVLSQKAIDLGLSKSLHERLMYDCNFEHIMLNIQYRMNIQISSFPSRRFYDSKIRNGPNVTSPKYFNGTRLQDRRPYTFLQVEGVEEQNLIGSYYNRAEARKIVELIKELEQSSSIQDRYSWYSTERIRVITFYQAQVSLIQRSLYEKGLGNTVVVSTVDASQGCEAEIVLISFVRSPSQRDGYNSSGFLNDDRRLNVALTRAKYQLICVGNVRNYSRMARSETLKLLSNDVEDRGLIRTPFAADDYDFNARLDLFYGKPPPSKRFKRGW